jgi:hypothetical protein
VRHHDDRPVIRISALPPSQVSVIEGQRTMVLCPEPGCGRWAYVHRGAIKPHHVTGKVRCRGSYRRIEVDLTECEHLALLYKIRHAADARRRSPVHGVRPAPVLPPVCRIGRAAA